MTHLPTSDNNNFQYSSHMSCKKGGLELEFHIFHAEEVKLIDLNSLR